MWIWQGTYLVNNAGFSMQVEDMYIHEADAEDGKRAGDMHI